MKEVVLRHIKNEDFKFNEAMKTLRTNIFFSGSNVKKILFTSTEPNEGKSFISLNLAVSLAESGKKICYIDADIRKSVFKGRYNVKEEVNGLSQILSGQAKLEESIYKTNVENLHVIFAGPYSPSPTELFEDKLCNEMFEKLAEMDYDYLIIDTAPLGVVIDAAILAKFTDGIIIVARQASTKKKVLSRVKDQIEKTNTRLLGVVLNDVNLKKSGYYGSYYSNYWEEYKER
ncbi:MAG: CpsD/CapB family tyrosine-protein kinase [Eubacteriales bacterium]|nr:CpsD/CapB family tyrosine-protein kinase [Eubacteriales bacterium]